MKKLVAASSVLGAFCASAFLLSACVEIVGTLPQTLTAKSSGEPREQRERPVTPSAPIHPPPPDAPRTYRNSIGMEFVLIPGGAFMMGCSKGDDWCRFFPSRDTETPRHKVTITRPFYLGKYEVTQAQWDAVMGSDPAVSKKAPNAPVVNVSWEDAQAFIARLNKREGVKRYRLPTEAEWEYAARAGSSTAYISGADAKEYKIVEDIIQMARYAWYQTNSPWCNGPGLEVGQKQPNAWGLYDMFGNVKEWVWDAGAYDNHLNWKGYSSGEAINPTGPALDEYRVMRGGDGCSDGLDVRSSARRFRKADDRDSALGFRLAMTIVQ